MVTKKLFNSREEWLQGRKNHIGGSDAAAYEEVSPGRRVDPETGEIFEDRRNGPIDLRRQQA